jgi:hypothetical protein
MGYYVGVNPCWLVSCSSITFIHSGTAPVPIYNPIVIEHALTQTPLNETSHDSQLTQSIMTMRRVPFGN